MKRPEGVRMGHGLSDRSLLTERCFLSFYYTAPAVHETARRAVNGAWLVILPFSISILGKMFGI